MRHLPSVAVVLLLSSSAFAELVTNGDFESPTVSAQFSTYTAVDSSSLTGWTVSSGEIDHIATYWTGADGGQSLDMSGNVAGQIQQTLTTVVGQSYMLRFQLTSNIDAGVGGSTTLQYDVGSGGADLSGTVTTTVLSSQSTSSMNWTLYQFLFTASSTSTLLSFTSLDNSAVGPALDDVSVLEAPEPGAFLLFGIGLGGLGLWRRTQKRRAPAAKA